MNETDKILADLIAAKQEYNFSVPVGLLRSLERQQMQEAKAEAEARLRDTQQRVEQLGIKGVVQTLARNRGRIVQDDGVENAH